METMLLQELAIKKIHSERIPSNLQANIQRLEQRLRGDVKKPEMSAEEFARIQFNQRIEMCDNIISLGVINGIINCTRAIFLTTEIKKAFVYIYKDYV